MYVFGTYIGTSRLRFFVLACILYTIYNYIIGYNNRIDIENDFARKRAQLVNDERSLRYDADFISRATQREKDANDIVNNLRLNDTKGIWEANSTLSYPGIGFLATKDKIEQTELYRVLKQLPKGGLLRTHMATMCEPQMILNLTLQPAHQDTMHVQAVSKFPGAEMDTWPAPKFKALTAKEAGENANNTLPTDPDYVPETWVTVRKAREGFAYGGCAGFDEWILRSMRLRAEERSRDNSIPVRAWNHLRVSYMAAQGIIFYEPILKEFLRQMLKSLVDDGISYSEIRTNFAPKYFTRANGSLTLSHRDFLILFREAIDDVKGDLEAEGRQGEFVGAKLIYNVFRTLGPEGLKNHLRNCMALKKEFPDLIAGFDFFGPEDISKRLSEFIKPLLWFQQETQKSGLDIPFLFLVGETIEDGNAADDNIYDAVLLGARRLGHGLNIIKHPRLMQMIKDRGVAVEVCPVANDNLGLACATHHPLRVLLNNNISVVLCSDNGGAFGNPGLSYDFYQVMASSIGTSLLSLKRLAWYSLEHSTLKQKDKEDAVQAWETRWKVFIDGIIDGRR